MMDKGGSMDNSTMDEEKATEVDIHAEVFQKDVYNNCELMSTGSSIFTNTELGQKEFIHAMKQKVVGIKKQLEGLKDTVKDVSSANFGAGLLKNDDIREQNIEVITNYIAFIRTQFKSLKIDGQTSYVCLHMLENDLQRDITTLKNTVAQGQELPSNISDTEYTKEVFKDHFTEDSNLGKKFIDNNSQSVSSAPCSVPLFNHDWDERDHIVFVRIFNKHMSHSKILEECQNVLSYRSKGEIFSHLNIYSKYLETRNNARELIRIWRENKEIEKQEKIKKIEKEKIILEMEEQKKKDKLIMKIKDEKELQYQKLREWKNSKIETQNIKKDKEIESNSYPIKDEKNKTALQSYTDKEREEISYRLKSYKDEKLRKELEEKSSCKRNIQTANDHKQKLLQLWKRDQEYILAKRQQKKLKDGLLKEEQVQMNKLVSKVNSRVPSNKSRILQTTVSHESYKRSKQKNSILYSIDHTEKRAVPKWREDL